MSNNPIAISAHDYVSFMRMFKSGRYSDKRLGEAFYEFMEMGAMTRNNWHNMLFVTDNDTARIMMVNAINWSN